MKIESLVPLILFFYVSIPLIYSVYIYIDNQINTKVKSYPSLNLLSMRYIGVMLSATVLLFAVSLPGSSGHGNSSGWGGPVTILWFLLPMFFIKRCRDIRIYIRRQNELEEQVGQRDSKLKFEKILVKKNAYESDDKYELIQGVIDFVNHIRSQGIEPDQVNVDAVNSYFVDYYSSEFCNGAFSQFVHNSGATDFILDCVAEGLQKMSATKNLELFLKCRQLVIDLSENELSEFKASEYFGENITRDKIDVYKWEFFDIKKEECIEDLHYTWLKNNKSVVALNSEEFTSEMNKIKGN